MIDSHTHCYHSHDSKTPPKKLIEKAIYLKMEYLAITDHCDLDYKYCIEDYPPIKPLDFNLHVEEISSLKKQYTDQIEVACGIEFGYSKQSEKEYIELSRNKNIDVIINSVHTIYGEDCYFPSFFERHSQNEAYKLYLECVRDSVFAPYNYQIIGHLGYIMRKSSINYNLLDNKVFKELIIEILTGIIQKEKTLEINTHVHEKNLEFLPTLEVLKFYKELGGTRVTFSSDAHQVIRLGEKYDLISKILKEIGFKYLTAYKEQKEIHYNI